MVTSWSHWFQPNERVAVRLREHPDELHWLGTTASSKKRPLSPRKTNYLYLLTHHRHLHHHLTKGNLETDRERSEAERVWYVGTPCWMRLLVSRAPARENIPVMVHPSLQLHQPSPLMLLGQAQPDRCFLNWESAVMSLPVLWKRGPMSNTSHCVKCSLPHKYKINSKLESFFLQNKLSDCFFPSPLAFTLKTFYFTMSQNYWSASLIHLPCIFLLTQYAPATSHFINSLFNHEDQNFWTFCNQTSLSINILMTTPWTSSLWLYSSHRGTSRL